MCSPSRFRSAFVTVVYYSNARATRIGRETCIGVRENDLKEAPMARKDEKTQGKNDRSGDTQPIPPMPSYQEGSVDSVGGGPTGTDDSDRSGEGTLPSP